MLLLKLQISLYLFLFIYLFSFLLTIYFLYIVDLISIDTTHYIQGGPKVGIQLFIRFAFFYAF